MKRRKKVIWIILTCTVLVIVGLVCGYIWNKNHTISLRDDFAASELEAVEIETYIGEENDSADRNANNTQLNQLENMKPGIDYVENQLVALADDKKEAEEIAARVGGTLITFNQGVATIEITETVYDVLLRLTTEQNPPEVYPSYIYSAQ